MRARLLWLTAALLIAACREESRPGPSAADYAALRAAYVAPAGFHVATTAGPCSSDPQMQCWTTSLLPTEAAHAAAAAFGPTYRTTDASWCGPAHWQVQRKRWGAAHAPCTLRGTARGLGVQIGAIAFPDRTKSTTSQLVFEPTVVSVYLPTG